MLTAMRTDNFPESSASFFRMVSPCAHNADIVNVAPSAVTISFAPSKAAADLNGRRLLGAGVFVGERPVEGGDVQAAASLVHQIEPGLEDGGVCGAGVKLQAFGDALHQNYPDKERKGNALTIMINIGTPGLAC